MASSASTDLGVSYGPMVPSSRSELPLRSGDHLDCAKFHKRYLAMPPEFRAELIDGVVIVSSPTSPQHGHPHNILGTALGVYEAQTPGTRAFSNTTVWVDENSEVQPDNMLIVLPEFGGHLNWEGGYSSGAPEFVAEIAYSSEAYDLHSKLRLYERAGVGEYFVLLLRERQAAYFMRQNDRFQRVAALDGAFKSQIFPGLWLDEAGMIEGDSAKVLATLQHGLATPEHADFVQRLAASRRP
jgi:Uma2 family endonuclease